MLFVWGTGKLSRQMDGHDGWTDKTGRHLEAGPGIKSCDRRAGNAVETVDADSSGGRSAGLEVDAICGGKL